MLGNTLTRLQSYLAAKDGFLHSYDLIVLILSVYNCRISEILSAKWQNFYPDKFLILTGTKKSSNIIIRDRAVLKSISALPKIDPIKIFPFISYYNIYHHIRKNYSHLLFNIKTKKNKKITHAFRYSNVSQLTDDNIIRDVLHHRSVKSGKFYKDKIIP